MSAVIKTTTPFVSCNLLCEALDALSVSYSVQKDQIITNLRDYYGNQIFIYDSKSRRYLFQHDSSANGRYLPYPWGMDVKQWGTVSSFLQKVDLEYKKAFQRLEIRVAEEKKLEEECRLKEEQERKHLFVENRKREIISKAREKGYSVKETKQGDKVHLVLVRTQY